VSDWIVPETAARPCRVVEVTMKVSPKDIKSIGLTVLYDPDNPSDAVAE
jgi:hypothetical protein